MKRTLIDDFAASFRPRFGETFSDAERDDVQNRLTELVNEVRPTFDAMNSIFDTNVVLLRQQSVFLIYYLVIEELLDRGGAMPTRERFADFAEELGSLRGQEEEDLTIDQRDALEYVEPLRETTTGSYTQRKAEILLRYVTGDLRIT